jgi:hypothetical protein
MRSAVATILCLAILVVASSAQAAQRHASPTGAGTACSEAEPCLLKEAITNAKGNDEVIVGTGTHPLTEPIFTDPVAPNLYIHGELNGPMPQIAVSGTVNAIGPTAVGVRFAYLDISNTTPGGFAVSCSTAGSIERVRATATGAGARAILAMDDCEVRDSIARAKEGGLAIFATTGKAGYTTVLRNVTAIATGAGSKGMFAFCTLCGPPGSIVDAKNGIFDGAVADLEGSSASGGAQVRVSNSNFDLAKVDGEKIVDEGGNQSAPPLFVDAANGDYREAAGSPTIDAGTNNLLGATDFEGNPRTVGAAADIGAFEFVPPVQPPPPPVPPGEIQSLTTSPRVFRAVNAGGAILSAKKKARAPIGTTVTYTLSAAAAVSFTVERKVSGRRVGKRCVKKTKANATKKRCPLFKPVKGGFSHTGAVGENRFRFSGRLAKALAPGSYRLTGKTSASSRAANFRIVR